MKAWTRIFLQIATYSAMGAVALYALLTGAYFYVEPSLPEADELRNYRPQIPMSIYSRDGRLMQQYGEQKRTPVPYDEIPDVVKQAFLAAEDDRFFEHSGIDYAGIVRGAIFLVTNPGERAPGGSTITQQVSRTANLMSRDYSFVRKFKEAILAFRIESEFTKEEIFGLFLNTTFFGQRANGIASAAQTYFNKDVDELTLSEVAIIAGIPQGPSIMNPYNGPENAATRRAYVLRRMFELGYIDRIERDAALAEPIVSQRFGLETELSADYVAQMAYEWSVAKFGKEVADSAGLNVITTVDSRLQAAANDALRAALESYDRNHGYRGPVGRIDFSQVGTATDSDSAEADPRAAAWLTALDDLLADYPEQFDSEAAVVVAVNDVFADVYLRSAGLVSLGLDSMSWARPFISDDRQGPRPESVTDVLAVGDIVRFRQQADGGFDLFQVPEVEGALVSVDPMDGAVVSLVGGYSFQLNAFNRVTQAGRQPGSSFKPFFYLSALANGYTLASIVNDAPFVEHSSTLETTRAVVNYGGVYHGEIPLRYALTESLNAAADRIVRDILPRNSIRYLERFGFGPDALPNNTSLALGSGSVTPLELAGAYSILANGGYSVGVGADGAPAPYFIDRIEDVDGNVLYDASLSVELVCREPEEFADDASIDAGSGLVERASDLFPPLRCAERVESPQRIYLITDVLKDVVKIGSGARAGRAFSSRNDLAGKTGTTTGPRDAWFAGFNADIVAVVRVGFDVDSRELGAGEQGGRTAIPAWIDFMRVALDGMPDNALPRPPGIVERRIDPETGLIASDCNRDAYWEMFLLENQPEREPNTNCRSADPLQSIPEQGSGTSPLFDIFE